ARTGESANRAGAETGFAGASLARMETGGGGRQVEFDRKEQGGAEGMPQAVGRVNIHAERRDVAGLGPPCPSEEGQRRLVEGIDSLGVEIARQAANHVPAPVVHQVMP